MRDRLGPSDPRPWGGQDGDNGRMWGLWLSTGRQPGQVSSQSPGLKTDQQLAGGKKSRSPRTHCQLCTKSKCILLHNYVGTPHLGQDASPEPPLPGPPLSPLPLQCLHFSTDNLLRGFCVPLIRHKRLLQLS